MKIAILTPTYNREKLLSRLYDSLLKQPTGSFIWIIIDDGSEDETENLIKSYISQDKVCIRYYKKNNGGKAAALNYGFAKNPDIDFFAVVDSDDWLYANAIDVIINKVEKYNDNGSVGAIFFKYSDVNGKPLYDSSANCLKEEICMTRYDHDSAYIKEDGCIGYYSKVTKKYKYPEYESEKYVGPIVIQMMMADEFTIAFTQDYIGYAEYQVGGLSKSGRRLRLKNPLGMIHYCGLLQSEKNKNLKSRIKYCIEAQAYAFVANVDRKKLLAYGIDQKYIKDWALIPGRILGMIWKRKYSNS